jgi:hypothetical protein
MRYPLSLVMLGVACLSFSGCGKSDDAAPVAAAPANSAATAPAQPEDILDQFLTALKKGDKVKAEGLLTTVAREKTAAEGIGISDLSAASSQMAFQIQGVQPLVMPDGKEAAHVSCAFTAKLDDGKTETHNIIWALRKESIGWRVAGMAWTPFAGEPPIFMDFEDPADMLRKQQLLAEEQERRANPQPAKPATTVAGQPAVGTPAVGASMTQPAPVAQPNTGVVQTGNTTPTNTTPTLPAPGQQPGVPQSAERFNDPAPLR